MDDLRAVRIFISVADLGSFAGAGRQLATTAASISRAIASLESQLGAQLLLRTTRKVSLTSAGAAYLARVRPLVDEFDAVSAEIQQEISAGEGLIRINAPLSLGQRVLPEVLADFRQSAPGIDLAVNLTDEFVDAVGNEADLAIRISRPPTDKAAIWRKICPVDRCLVTRPGDPAASVKHPDALDLSRCWAFSAEGRPQTWDLSGRTAHRRLRVGERLSVNNGDFLAQMVAGQGGVALLPRFIVAEELRAGRLVEILSDWRASEIWLSLYYPPYEKLPPRISVFSDFFERHVTERRPLSKAVIEGQQGQTKLRTNA